jgi:hypothetical protein
VADSDAANYFGAAPDIDIEMLLDGQDTGTPPGPNISVGSSITLTYIVTNTGNMPLSALTVTDDNGTPFDQGDDFAPAFVGGDTNSNNVLDLGETWTYTATRTVIEGENFNSGEATGNDIISQAVSDEDRIFHVGVVPENADFNDDGIVDTSDYVIWRKSESMTVPAGTLGDANFDTQVDDDDYMIWQKQYGTSPGGGGAAAGGNSSSESISSQAAPGSETSSMSANALASRDAAFSALAVSGVSHRTAYRPAQRSEHRAAPPVDTLALSLALAVLADEKAQPSAGDLEIVGVCPVGPAEVEVVGDDPSIARITVLPRGKTPLPVVSSGRLTHLA